VSYDNESCNLDNSQATLHTLNPKNERKKEGEDKQEELNIAHRRKLNVY
jgi:hypothetical protein